MLAVAAPRRYRNREHLRYVAQQACLVCGRKPSDPHHLGFTKPRALGRKVSDEFAVPLCRGHHRAVHRSRDERGWWRQAGIDPIKVARRLWKETHGMGPRRPRREVSPRPQSAAASSDPRSEDISATATTQEESRLPDLPGREATGGDDEGRPNEPAEDGVSNLPGVDLKDRRRRSRRRAWRHGLALPNRRSGSRRCPVLPSVRAPVIASVDPRSVIELALGGTASHHKL